MQKTTFSGLKRHSIPEHIRSLTGFSGVYPFSILVRGCGGARRQAIPEDIRSFLNRNALTAHIFQTISVHFPIGFSLFHKPEKNGAYRDTFDVAKSMIFSETVTFYIESDGGGTS